VAWFAALTVGSLVIEVIDAVPQAWFPQLWYQFGVGVLAYHALGERSARILLALILLALVGLGATRGQASDLTVVVVGGLLVATGLGASLGLPGAPKAALGLGRISYSLYLVHGFIGLGLAACFRSSMVRSETAAWIAITASTVAAVGFASLFYLVVESQGIKWSRRVRVSPDRP
jgi:peptidoglycan/LPS O-acetylase OafA/YrhL